MDSLIAKDNLNFICNNNFQNIVGKDESLLWSGEITKVNKKGKEQFRDFVITNKNIYNLGKKSNFLTNWFTSGVKRKMPIDKIEAITYSAVINFFVLHMPEEYDYYLFTKHRNEIIEYLIKIRAKLECEKPLLLFVVGEADLRKYSKTDTEKFDKWPKNVPSQKLTSEYWTTFVANLEKKKKNNIENTEVLISQSGEKVNEDSFEMLKTLGKGYYGRVFLCEKKDSKDLYAVKVMSKLDIIKRNFFDNLKNEKMILEKVNNRFVVNLEFCFANPSYIFFVMEFKQGGELYHHLRKRTRFSEKITRFYGAQILLGLHYLHSLNIMYRDMKPENILLDENGNAALADYGISKIIKEGEKTKSFVGTPDYVAPEIILQKGHNKMVDVWCFGIILYEMIYGLPPFYNKQQNIMLNNIIKINPTFPKMIKISPELEDIITLCLQKDPKKRIGNNGLEEIMKHKFFEPLDWELMKQGKIDAPIKPEVKDKLDVDNFNTSKEKPKLSNLSQIDKNIIENYENKFSDF